MEETAQKKLRSLERGASLNAKKSEKLI